MNGYLAMMLPSTITGREPLSGDDLAIDALIAFYHAFNARDLDAMALNWAGGDDPSMDNPIGGIRRGWPTIRSGYERLFQGPARVYVEFHDFSGQVGQDFHLFVGRERGTCETSTGKLELRIRTSRLFVRRGSSWRQLHHHGSIEEPNLLADYQRMILGAPLEAPV